ncbi:MAG: putative toxin-antitoxin system toxin component, PIN family [Synergistaceae bacterium]|jgi:putative PIN family toxin of toxin-antitoxin system|nr:putative toxin-antitoxin system toxin component, PIN family [Synergistaceae bacterium]
MLVVIDTNVLVSALYSRDGSPAKVIALVQNGVATPCYDYRILIEYREVLARPKFNFAEWEITDLLSQIESDGLSVSPRPLNIELPDEEDRKFYEVAKHCHARLITGNLKHFPNDKIVLSVREFLDSLL